MKSKRKTNEASGVSGGAEGRLRVIFAIYLLGMVLGGLYVGLVAPVRLVIQEYFGLIDTEGIWMINVYTLFYAALIPVIGKLADLFGRKPLFLCCLSAFSLGALLCGVSAWLGGFPLLLAGRVIQAAGACGVIPVANAEIGATFPPEKRGAALGISAAAAGIANVLGAGVGSGLLGLFGNANWPWLFFVAVPAAAIIAFAAATVLPNNRPETEGKVDYPGSLLIIVLVLLMLFSLQGLDFFDLVGTVSDVRVWGTALAAAVVLVVFVLVERRSADPVFHLEYLSNGPIVITMIASFFVGCIVICMTLIPEISEFILDAPVGSGGLYMLPVGILGMFGPPIGGKLIDRFGPKPVMISGLAGCAIGYLFLAFVSLEAGSVILLLVGLFIMGFGMGFAMGAPLNYMILENTNPEESSSAIASITLIRQVGTTLAPAILLGFPSAMPGAAGYRGMMICIAVFAVISIVVVMFYRPRKTR